MTKTTPPKKTIKIRIIDKRVKEKFVMDDAYLNGQARICGWQATLVYLSLCRHANRNQESFPSVKLIAEELGVSDDTVTKGIQRLCEYNVITVNRNRNKSGMWKNNTYTLLDKSCWLKELPHTAHSGMDHPHRSQRGGRAYHHTAHSGTKETHIFKETHNNPLIVPPLKIEVVKRKNNFIQKYSSISDIVEEDIIEIAKKYGVSTGFVVLALEKLKNYCESHGRKYKNYKAALRNFVVGDMQRIVEKKQEKKGGFVDATQI